jgi:hypothetical protein
MFSAYPRCCEFASTGVNSDGQAYDAKGFCTIGKDMDPVGGMTCEKQVVVGATTQTIMLVAAGIIVLLLLTQRRR